MTLHRRLEERLADFLGMPAALLFGSGYLANLGHHPRPRRARRDLFCDALRHASVADACRLAGAETFSTSTRTPTTSPGGCATPTAAGRSSSPRACSALEGDSAPLELIVAWPAATGCALVDDSHASGPWAPTAPARWPSGARAGRCLAGSLGTALGSAGAYVAATARPPATWWRAPHRSGSTAPPPPVVAAAMAALEPLARAAAAGREAAGQG